MRIAFTTCQEYPDPIAEDHLLITALEARGAIVSAAPWNGPFTPFAESDLVLIRTPWDYHNHAAGFLTWLSALERREVRVVNDIALLRWNMDKHYLVDLASRGAPLPETFVSTPDATQILGEVETRGLNDIVIKPAISASSHGLSRIEQISEDRIAAALAGIDGDVLVQAIVPEIQTAGETSLVFFGGAFSHAVRKMPTAGDIRCQPEFGGSATAVAVPAGVVERAMSILDLLPAAPVYARVDLIIAVDKVLLMEVEVIEPELYFRFAPDAAEKFAGLITEA